MRIKILGVFVILFSLGCSQNIIAQRVFIATVGVGVDAVKYAAIDCSGMPKRSVKSPEELVKSKIVDVSNGSSRVRRHLQIAGVGGYINSSSGTNSTLIVNSKVSRRFAISTTDINDYGESTTTEGISSWAAASGWEYGANYNIEGADLPALSGCVLYKGKDNKESEFGKWRLPTQRELLVIYTLYGQLESTSVSTGLNVFVNGNYVSSSEFAMSQYLSVDIIAGGVYTSYKGARGSKVRCIRDL